MSAPFRQFVPDGKGGKQEVTHAEPAATRWFFGDFSRYKLPLADEQPVYDADGKRIGTATNFRLEGGKVIADFVPCEAADEQVADQPIICPERHPCG